MPQGTPVVGVGLLLAGLTTYAYLALTARAVGPERYAGVSALWAGTVLTSLGFFLPLEQEVARAVAARTVQGVGGRPVLVRAGQAGVLIALALLALLAAAGPTLERELFDGDAVLLISLAIGLVTYCAMHLTRGLLAGASRFRGYAVLLGGESLVRLCACVVLFVVGVTSPGPFGLALALAPAAVLIATLSTERGLLTPGPPAPLAEVATSLGHLIVASVLAQALVNGPPIAVKLLAGADDEAAAGRFLAGLVVARIPLFLFAAVQAALLPRLSALAAAGHLHELRLSLLRLLGVVAATGAAASVGAIVVGPFAVRVLFGAGFVLSRSDLGLLAAASGAYLLALVATQALIALGHQAAAVAGWLTGVLVLGLALLPQGELIRRVELAFLSGSVAAAAASLWLLRSALTHAVDRGHAVAPALVVDPMEP